MLKSILKILPALLVAVACADPDRAGSTGNNAASAPPAGDEAPPPAEGQPVCLQGERYVADGAVPVSPPSGGDTERIAALRLGRHDGCERLVIDLAGADGGDASVPGVVTADVLRDLGVVRVRLREVEAVESEATEARFGSDFVTAAYTVRSPEGRWLFVDIHLAQAAEASVLVLEEPARVVVDLRPGGAPLPEPAAAGQRVVILEPRPGEASYPLTVTGYGRMFEANAEVRLEQRGRMVRDTFTTATDYTETWGYYEVTIGDGPSGNVTLHAGEHSARDGTWEGVEVPLRIR